MQFTRLLILESALKSTLGHHYEYIKSVSDAAIARGMQVVVACNRNVEAPVQQSLNVLPLFRMSHYDKALPISWNVFQQTGRRLNGLIYAWRFYRDCMRPELLAFVDDRTVVFIPTATEVGTIGLTLWMRRAGNERNAHVVCLLRYDPRQFAKWVVSLMKPFLRLRRIMLATDSDQLAAEYMQLTGEPFTVLPIPHLPHFSLPQSSQPPAPVSMLFLGGAREEKGIVVLVEAIKAVTDELNRGALQFVIQCNTFLHEESTVQALIGLERLALQYPSGIRLIKHPLSTDDYYQLLLESDVVVIPYQRQAYTARSSGILAEAFAAAKPVIVTEGTWMSAQLGRSGSGLVMKDGDAEDLARLMREAVVSITTLQARARHGREEWLRFHNAEHLLDIITGDWVSNARSVRVGQTSEPGK